MDVPTEDLEAKKFSKLDNILDAPEEIGMFFEPSRSPETLCCIRIAFCAEMALSAVFCDYERETDSHHAT